MNLFEFRPQKNTKKLALTTGLLIIGAAVLMLATVIIENIPYRWAIQLLSLGMLVMGIFITTRYIMKSYVYAIIENGNGGKDFTVTEIQNKNVITVCRIGLDNIEQIVSVPLGNKEADAAVKNKIKAEKRKQFNYCADLFAEKYICIFVTECGEAIAIKLTCDEEMETVLENALSESREDE